MTTPQAAGWTEDRVSTLRDLLAQGQTATQVGRVLGVTRNSIIGKAVRLGIPMRSSLQALADANAQRAVGTRLDPPRAPVRIVSPRAFLPLPGPPPVPFFDRPAGSCRWPIDGGEEPLACGHPAGGRYCPPHTRMSAGGPKS